VKKETKRFTEECPADAAIRGRDDLRTELLRAP
jgi:hypothetical protein